MKSTPVSRRSFATRLALVLSLVGVTEGTLAESADAQTPQGQGTGVQKLNYQGKPADGTQMITPLIVHNGLIYISGQGERANWCTCWQDP